VSLTPEIRRELCDLLGRLRDGQLDDPDLARLDKLVAGDATARRLYLDYIDLCVSLHWAREQGQGIGSQSAVGEEPESTAPPIILDLSPPPERSFAARLFTPGEALFSYTLSAVILGVALLIGWAWRVSYRQDAATDQAQAVPQPPSVGRITDLVDCRWDGPGNGTFARAPITLGRTYRLVSGLMEIAYDSGDKVILQGPAIFQVDSANGGYLSLGKLTARVASRESRVRSGDDSQLSTLDSRLFSVRTPTAVVTDLGTEFGVEVDKSGITKSHVFQGKVSVRSAVGGAKPVYLGENEETIVTPGQQPVLKVTRGADRSGAAPFVRQMPRWTPIRVFNTGVGLREGDPDPHWQLVARSDDPTFIPRSAVVMGTPRVYLPNDPARSQWISLAGAPSEMPEAVFTFRTTFKLGEAAAPAAVLRGRFLADDRVQAVRLNGRAVPVPERGKEGSYEQFGSFVAKDGFVEGTNTLEIDVFNRMGSRKLGTPMALRGELEGFMLREGSGSAAGAEPPEVPPGK
jgi:hypothetical protein